MAFPWLPIVAPLGETGVMEDEEPRFDNEGRSGTSLPPTETVFLLGTGATTPMVMKVRTACVQDTTMYDNVPLPDSSGGIQTVMNVSTKRDDRIFSNAGWDVSRSIPCSVLKDPFRVMEASREAA